MITGEISDFIQRVRPCFVATVSPNNKPNVSPKGSLMVDGDSDLFFADIRSPDTIHNLKQNPAIQISVTSPVIRKGYTFSGMGHVLYEGAEFDRMLGRLRKGGIRSAIQAIVVTHVDLVEEIKSPLYDLGYTEEQIRLMWKD